MRAADVRVVLVPALVALALASGLGPVGAEELQPDRTYAGSTRVRAPERPGGQA